MTKLAIDGGPCPCGTGRAYVACCGPFLAGAARPPTAEALMRSRYTAFVRGDTDHLWRTWHPRTRPDEVTLDLHLCWTGLAVTATADGGEGDETGEVAFEATYTGPDGPELLTERSRFVRRAGRWVYLDGTHPG